MCVITESLLIASLALTAASGTASYIAADQNANAQSKYYAEVQNATTKEALESFYQQTDTINLRAQQDAAAASETALGELDAIARERGQMGTALGESGFGGGSLTDLFADYDGLRARTVGNLRTTQDWNLRQLQLEAEGVRSATQARISGGRGRPVERPSLLAYALNTGSNMMPAAIQLAKEREKKNG
jgi:hypothetical protein